jgi:hypothetical protein
VSAARSPVWAIVRPSVRHLDRLLGGLLLATSPRIDWAKLIRRTFGIDALRCAHCAGRLRLLAAITEKATARKILEHLACPPIRPLRDPGPATRTTRPPGWTAPQSSDPPTRHETADGHPTRRHDEANMWARGTPAPRLDELNVARTVWR